MNPAALIPAEISLNAAIAICAVAFVSGTARGFSGFGSALIFMPVIGSVIASTHVDPVAKAKADIVMYPDKFDTKKVSGLTGLYVRLMDKLISWPVPTLAVGFGVIVAILFLRPAGFLGATKAARV